MSWQTEYSTESKAPPEAVWERYTDVENWKEWSQKGVERSSLDGDFKVGATGTSKAPHLPKGKFELIEVEPERKFVSKAGMPGATLYFEHMVEPAGEGSRITHRATLEGPLAVVWAPLVGRIIERGMPDGVNRLAKLAVKKQKEKAWEEEEERQRKLRLEQADMEFKEEIEKTALGDETPGGASVPGG
jgi:uncharacterized protein YndB with AHSA1/START domain